jgi:hypothetical protein
VLKQFPADHHPTFFEVVTVMALKFFAEQKCDLVIWETGLGGRLDATNIVTPLASVITNIAVRPPAMARRHAGKIAAEKAGIIKPGVPVVTATDAPEALAVIEKIAREKNAPLTMASDGRDAACKSKFRPLFRAAALPYLSLPANTKNQRRAGAGNGGDFAAANSGDGGTNPRRAGRSVNWPGRLQLIQNGRTAKKSCSMARTMRPGQKFCAKPGEKFPRRQTHAHSWRASGQGLAETFAKRSRRWRREFSPCRLPASAPPMPTTWRRRAAPQIRRRKSACGQILARL